MFIRIGLAVNPPAGRSTWYTHFSPYRAARHRHLDPADGARTFKFSVALRLRRIIVSRGPVTDSACGAVKKAAIPQRVTLSCTLDTTAPLRYAPALLLLYVFIFFILLLLILLLLLLLFVRNQHFQRVRSVREIHHRSSQPSRPARGPSHLSHARRPKCPRTHRLRFRRLRLAAFRSLTAAPPRCSIPDHGRRRHERFPSDTHQSAEHRQQRAPDGRGIHTIRWLSQPTNG